MFKKETNKNLTNAMLEFIDFIQSDEYDNAVKEATLAMDFKNKEDLYYTPIMREFSPALKYHRNSLSVVFSELIDEMKFSK